MSFDSLEEAEALYYSYAGSISFSVRKGSTRHSKRGLRKKNICMFQGRKIEGYHSSSRPYVRKTKKTMTHQES
ncbi:hypothetical protein ZOSMA_208G00090 [Zostera marina]|uniref:FAR1 domain-containing protein n=1 Tax=Zostera marina TaxID=29655 RepID=A0A0K9PKY6_ZOSMR|nr:hypothetical protein ZOSMA_208G00090 [Zostera marina]